MGYYHLDGILSESSLHQLKHTLCEGFVKLDATIIFSVNQKFVEQDATNSQWHLAHMKCEYSGLIFAGTYHSVLINMV